ncbi:hypothetical protein N431DRAFT_484240 [Stipitochalara longipes BDJ]|nr:hypothetical protein N431DRAFT_484240 [Stipitochalara longipes BDJ]
MEITMADPQHPSVVSPQTSASSLQAKINEKAQLQQESHLKRSIRILKLIARLIALVLAIATGAQETITLHTYLTTQYTMRSGRDPWSLQTKLWLTIMLLSVSFLTIIFSFLTILAYLRHGVKAANRAHRTGFVFEILVEAGHVLIWIVVAALYRVGKTGHDLWGWACSPLAQSIQPNFEGVVDFQSVCKRGNKSWGLSILSAALQGLTALTLLLALERRKQKQRLAVARQESTNSAAYSS